MTEDETRACRGSARRLGAGSCQHVHGSVVGADPFAAAALSCRRPRRQHADDRHHRGHRRSDRADRQDILRRALGLFRRRKALVVLGYGLAAVTKLVFPLASTARLGRRRALRRPRRQGHPRRAARRAHRRHHARRRCAARASGCARRSTPSARSVDRCSRSPRWRRSPGDFQAAFWVAVVPAFLSVALLVVGVDEPDRRQRLRRRTRKERLRLADAKRLGRGFAIVVTIAAVLTLARFSEAFLILRARDVGLALGHAPWVMVVDVGDLRGGRLSRRRRRRPRLRAEAPLGGTHRARRRRIWCSPAPPAPRG